MTLPETREQTIELVRRLQTLVQQATTEDEARVLTSRIAQITRAYRIKYAIGLPATPIEQATEIDPSFIVRDHAALLSDQITNAVRGMERGKNQHLAVSLPPRSGKSTLISLHTPVWLLRRHPEWSIITTSHDGGLTTGWAREARRIIESRPGLGIALRKDGGAFGEWETVEGGGLTARSVRSGLTGRGARVLIIDDPIRDFVEAHSATMRQNLWDWWLSVAQTRLEPPYMVLVVMTRWHEDDFVGRLFSEEWEGDPRDWRRLSIPAIAEADDLLGRPVGAPLHSPIIEETEEQALDRWASVKKSVGSYTFASMYQQRPAPARGAIFDAGWWRFWTLDPTKATDDERVVHLDPSTLTGGTWCDSWDCNFESDSSVAGGWVVGQRWVRHHANRFLIAQQRGRWTFTQTIAAMERWARIDSPTTSPCGHLVHTRLIEKKANGAAAIDVLKDRISGIKPINPTASKEIRARAVTPECESGNVLLPHPTDPGNEWVADLLSELRNFPHDAADDQVDTLSQALSFLRGESKGGLTVPGGRTGFSQGLPRNVARAAYSDLSRRR